MPRDRHSRKHRRRSSPGGTPPRRTRARSSSSTSDNNALAERRGICLFCVPVWTKTVTMLAVESYHPTWRCLSGLCTCVDTVAYSAKAAKDSPIEQSSLILRGFFGACSVTKKSYASASKTADQPLVENMKKWIEKRLAAVAMKCGFSSEDKGNYAYDLLLVSRYLEDKTEGLLPEMETRNYPHVLYCAVYQLKMSKGPENSS
ncbi:hypothetical protein CBL_08484 [Carabus blaptoides fortunei]